MAVSITGSRIRLRRKELGMSADKLAEMIGVSRATLYRYENGDIEKVPVDFMSPLSKALNVPPSYLMGWEDDAAPAPPDSDEDPQLAAAKREIDSMLSDMTLEELALVKVRLSKIKESR